ncbi:formylmethanofuran--tetrahydromethanopterin N-formyltransferase [Methanopyrus sp.]
MAGLEVNGVPVEDTYCEAFKGLYARFIVTAADERPLREAAENVAALPATVFGESEAGIERWLDPDETPDGRPGFIAQVWVEHGKKAVERLERELGKRIRQGVLVRPTTRVFDACENPRGHIDTERPIGRCGDGYEYTDVRFGREVVNIPIMMGEFQIERRLGYGEGVAGGLVWLLCEDTEAALEAGYRAVDALRDVEGVITPFNVCAAGSKPETLYPDIGPTTNHPYCPTLRDRILDSKVPEGVEAIPEIVINGVSLDAVKRAIRTAIEAATEVDGVVKITAGNFGGKLGDYRIPLRECLHE